MLFCDKLLLKSERLRTTVLRTFPLSARVFRESTLAWLGEKLSVKDLIRRRLGVSVEKSYSQSNTSCMQPVLSSAPRSRRLRS